MRVSSTRSRGVDSNDFYSRPITEFDFASVMDNFHVVEVPCERISSFGGMLLNAGEKTIKYFCSFCNEDFPTKNRVLRHFITHIGDGKSQNTLYTEKGKYYCTICDNGVGYNQATYLYDHICDDHD